MRRFVSGFCCLVVGLQILIGVPLAVCVAFFALVEPGGVARLEIIFRSVASDHAESNPLVANAAVPLANARLDEADFAAILAAREQFGSPLAETGLQPGGLTRADPECFLAALRQIAINDSTGEQLVAASATRTADAEAGGSSPESMASLVDELSRLAEEEESAGQFQRAHQWRGLADQIRGRAN